MSVQLVIQDAVVVCAFAAAIYLYNAILVRKLGEKMDTMKVRKDLQAFSVWSDCPDRLPDAGRFGVPVGNGPRISGICVGGNCWCRYGDLLTSLQTPHAMRRLCPLRVGLKAGDKFLQYMRRALACQRMCKKC